MCLEIMSKVNVICVLYAISAMNEFQKISVQKRTFKIYKWKCDMLKILCRT